MDQSKFENTLLYLFVGATALVLLVLVISFLNRALGLSHIFQILFLYITAGMLISYGRMIVRKEYKTLAISIIFPPWLFKYILSMEETLLKKLLAIMVMGCFVLYVIIGILQIIMTPQM